MKNVLRRVLQWALRLIGPLLLVYFLMTTDLALVWDILRQSNLGWFLLSCVLLAPFLVLKGLRWKMILDAWDMRLGLKDATALYTVGIFLGVVTPGQAGDAVKAWYLKQRGHPLAPGLLSIVVDRFFDVAIMGTLAFSGVFFFRDFLPDWMQWLMVAAMGGVLAGLLVLGSRRVRNVLKDKVAPVVVPRKLRELVATSSLSGRSLHLSPSKLASLALVSALGLGLTFVRLYLLFFAVGEEGILIGPYVAMIAIISIVQTVSVGGIGVREAVMVPILARYGIAPEFALSISALFLLLNLLNVLVGFLVSLRYPLADLRKLAEEEGPSTNAEGPSTNADREYAKEPATNVDREYTKPRIATNGRE